MKKKIHIIAGARPNFMKIAPIIRELGTRKESFEFQLIHTGQHYDHDMSDVFFEELAIPKPDFHLDIEGGSHSQQTASIMIKYEEILLANRPDIVLVVGDVNSTIATVLVAKKMGLLVAHVEAGLRSGDLTMPEEINRLATDSISDLLFATEPSAVENLNREGKSAASIHFVGNVMVDNLLFQFERLKRSGFQSPHLRPVHGKFAVATLHRPANVDNLEKLTELLTSFNEISAKYPIYFPVHPRTAQKINQFSLQVSPNVFLLPPLGYMDFLSLWSQAEFVLTDSGGLQEETTALGVECFTLRDNTERPITISEGTNTLLGTNGKAIVEYCLTQRQKKKPISAPQFWDGRAAVRIVDVLESC